MESIRMKSSALVLALVGAASSAVFAEDRVEIRSGTTVEFGDAAACARVLSTRDVFVRAMSPFDRSARLKTDRDVSESEYLAFVARQAMDWTSSEKLRVMPILESFRAKTAALNLRFPPLILLLKTTGLEEGMAAYCRGPAIVIPAKLIDGDQTQLEPLIFHELFHVYRSHNPAERSALYKIVGFHVCPEIVLPPELSARKITNPDAPLLDSFIQVRAGNSSVAATPVLFARTKRYDTKTGGEFFDSMVFKLLILARPDSGFQPALLPDGGADLRSPADIPDYLDQIGRNTKYIIHPDEILADNFVLMINQVSSVPTPRIPQSMRTLLTR
jgi:hypothetical protein